MKKTRVGRNVSCAPPPTIRTAVRADAKRIHDLVELDLQKGRLLPRQLSELEVHIDRFVVAVDGRGVIGGDACMGTGVVGEVEEASKIGASERSGDGRGMYHGLGGRLSPLDGIGPEDLTIPQLETRVSAGVVREVIIATNLMIEGETTALYVQRKLARFPLTVSRIARGLPVGGDLEYADGVTIAQALTARRAMS